MPTTRLQSAGPSTPAPDPATPAKPSSFQSTRRSTSRSRTPSHTQSQPHGHHRTADEITLQEAQRILHTRPVHQASVETEETPSARGGDRKAASPLQSGRTRSVSLAASSSTSTAGATGKGGVIVELPSLAASAKKLYTPIRSGRSPSKTTKNSAGKRQRERSSVASASTPTEHLKPVEQEWEPVVLGELASDDEAREIGGDEGIADVPQEEENSGQRRAQSIVEPSSDAAASVGDPDASETPALPTTSPDRGDRKTSHPNEAARTGVLLDHLERRDASDSSAASDSASETSSASSTDDSASDSDSETDTSSADDSDDDSDEDSVDSDEEEERLDKLLAAAKLSAGKASLGAAGEVYGSGGIRMGEDDVLRLDVDDEVNDAPIPRMTVAGLPAPSLVFSKDGSAKAGPSRLPTANGHKKSESAVTNPSEQTARTGVAGPIPELDNRPYERPLSKREKANQPKKATPSELWSTLPSARTDLLPQMKRDYQALALANSMDPKRFMKGGLKTGKVPESFAIGTVVEQPRHLQNTTMTREHKYRPGQLVQEVVADAGVSEYAKRKFGDLQWKRMENGRGKGWKKRTKW